MSDALQGAIISAKEAQQQSDSMSLALEVIRGEQAIRMAQVQRAPAQQKQGPQIKVSAGAVVAVCAISVALGFLALSLAIAAPSVVMLWMMVRKLMAEGKEKT